MHKDRMDAQWNLRISSLFKEHSVKTRSARNIVVNTISSLFK